MKMWEKCAITKIAIKRGVQNTCNERMAEELKVKPYLHCYLNIKKIYVKHTNTYLEFTFGYC